MENTKQLNQIVKPAVKEPKEISLDLNQFIDFLDLDMILNNDLINNDNFYFEMYNYEEQLNKEYENNYQELKDDIENGTNYILSELLEHYTDITEQEFKKEYDNDIYYLSDALDEYTLNNFYNGRDIYQWFIVPDRQVEYWEQYTNYDIYYCEKMDLYLLGISHWGMSWHYFPTGYYISYSLFKDKYGTVDQRGSGYGYYNYKYEGDI